MILLAGATGVLGVEVAKRLQSSQILFRCLVRKPANGAAHQITGDLLRPESLQRAMEGVDGVISCAGASMKLGGIADRASFYQVDAQGNQNLLNAASGANVACARKLSRWHSKRWGGRRGFCNSAGA